MVFMYLAFGLNFTIPRIWVNSFHYVITLINLADVSDGQICLFRHLIFINKNSSKKDTFCFTLLSNILYTFTPHRVSRFRKRNFQTFRFVMLNR